MGEWGNNPATYQAVSSVVGAVGVVALFVSTLLAWRALRETRAQRQAIEREMAVRMRPWVGLFGFRFDPSGPSGNTLFLLLRNFGVLPAQQANLSLVIRPLQPEENEPDNPIRRSERGEKVLLPNEEGNYTIDLSKYSQFALWRNARRDVRVEGVFSYAIDALPLRTSFEATLWFSEGDYANDRNVRINWRNTKAQ